MHRIKQRKAEGMKDSGVEWIGQVPAEWKTGRIQQCFEVRSKKVSDKEYEALSVTKNGIVKQLETAAKTDNGDNRKQVLINDFVINSRADRKGSCGVSSYEGSVSLICHVLMPRNNMVPLYVNHLFRNYYFSEEFYRWGTGIVDDLWSTNIDRMKKIMIPIPDDQHKIANFLDIKTAQFDSIIAKKELLIKKLEEAKKSLISEVVTGKVKIVNGEMIARKPDEMKASGIEWLGMIPIDWKDTKVKHELINFDYKRIPLSSEERGKMTDTEYDYYGASGVIDKVDSYLFDGKYILVGEDGANLYSRSTVLAYIAEGKFWANNHAHILKARNENDDYYMYLLETVDYFKYITGSAQPKLTQDNLGSIRLYVSSDEEQILIQDLLNNKVKLINSTVKKYEKQLNFIQQAKQALISEAVTGKIDLRDWEIIEEGELS